MVLTLTQDILMMKDIFAETIPLRNISEGHCYPMTSTLRIFFSRPKSSGTFCKERSGVFPEISSADIQFILFYFPRYVIWKILIH
jgi:hypothetical protein